MIRYLQEIRVYTEFQSTYFYTTSMVDGNIVNRKKYE